MKRWLPFEYAVRNLGRGRLRTALNAGGCALVVLLILGAGGFVRGMQRSLTISSGEHNVVLLGAGSEDSIERSEIEASVAGIVSSSITGIRQQLGVSYVSPEFHIAAPLALESGSTRKYMGMLRGVRPEAFLVHARVQIVEGRAPEANEVLVGRLAGTRMGLDDSALAVGGTLWFDQRPWTISGRFEAPGTVLEAEIWVPLTDLQMALKRENKLSCVVLTLDRATFGDVEEFARTRLDLELAALRESTYYGKLSEFFWPVQLMVWISAGLMVLGGFFGGLNTMYAAFGARVRELGALQALGYRRRALVFSLVQESLLTATAGALLATGLGLWLLDGVGVRFSMGAFRLVLDGQVLTLGLLAGLLLGVAGALPPAWRCLRLPISEALKAA